MQLRKRLVLGVTLSAMMAPACADAAIAQTRGAYRFNIQRQDMASALKRLAIQTNTQIIYSDARRSGVMVHALVGEYRIEEALSRLLAGTHFAYTQLPGGVIRVYLAGAQQSGQTDTGAQLRPVAVSRLTTVPDVPQQSSPAPSVDAPSRPEAEARDIIVTGSRVIANGNNSPTPVTVMSANELLAAQPAGVVAAMNELPALLGSINTTSSVNTGGFSTINLRGVGATRALIMLDGHRVLPSRATGAVNPDLIPQILLQRVDVVTGGVSAVYGSDAVAGVVNFITDTKFKGFKANVQGGLSQYGDDSKIDIGLAWGGKFADDRGHFEIGYEFRNAPGIKSRADRPFTQTRYAEEGAFKPVAGVTTPAVGSAANPYQLTANPTLSTASFGGLITSGPLQGLQFAQNGMLSTFTHGAATGTAGVEVGGDGAYYTGNTLSASQRIHNGYARADYDFNESIHGYASLALTDLTQGYTAQNVFLSSVAIGYNNPFLNTVQSQYQAIIAAQPAGSFFNMGKMMTNLPDYRYIAKETFYQGAIGLDGDVGRLKWNVDYVHSDSREALTNTNNVNAGRLYAALNAVSSGGQTVCNAALANPSAYGGCVPFNAFGPSAANQSAINYVEQATHSAQHFRMDDISGTLRGPAFNLPAGPLQTALSADWRRLSYDVTSDAQPTDTVNCAGILLNCTASSSPYLGGSVVGLPTVSQTVGEVALEFNAPLLADTRFFKALNLNGAVRYTHYNTSGGVWTWKLGGDWQVSDELHLRATRSRDIRAPNLIEQYAPPSYAIKNYVDLHTNTSGLITQITQGNPSLTPEKATTWTIGGVYKPHFLPGLSLSLDYYRINIKNAITVIDAFSPATQQACEASGGTASICGLYTRPKAFSVTDASNYPNLIYARTLNVAAVRTYGIDFEANYATRLAQRPLALRALLNWQPHMVFDNGPSGIVDVGGAADGVGGLPPVPSVKVLASLSYDLTDALKVRVQERWRNAMRQNGNPALVFVDGDIKSAGYTDLTVNYSINKALSAFVNVQNLFNKWPQVVASAGGSVQIGYLGGFAQGDDIEGRFITMGVKLRM